MQFEGREVQWPSAIRVAGRDWPVLEKRVNHDLHLCEAIYGLPASEAEPHPYRIAVTVSAEDVTDADDVPDLIAARVREAVAIAEDAE